MSEFTLKPSRYADLLVLPRNATLPMICVQCAAPAIEEPLTERFINMDESPELMKFIARAFGLLGVLFVMLVVGAMKLGSLKGIIIKVPLCPRHRRATETKKLVGKALIILALPIGAFMWWRGGPEVGAVVGLIAGFAALIVGVAVYNRRTPLKAVCIDSISCQLKGASHEFLNEVDRQLESSAAARAWK